MLKRIENKIRIWATKMEIAEDMGDINTYNKCVLKIQEFEAQLEALLY